MLEVGPQHPVLLVVQLSDAVHGPGLSVVEEDPAHALGVPGHHHQVLLHVEVGLPLARVPDPAHDT